MSQENLNEYEERGRKYREAVAPYLGGQEVEAVGAFERPFSWWDNQDEVLGMLVGAVVRAFSKPQSGRLGDLPESFLLAVTRDKVHALSYREKRSDLDVEENVADFDRESISFTREMGTWAEVAVLELTEGGQKSRIQVKGDALSANKNPWAAEVLAALSK